MNTIHEMIDNFITYIETVKKYSQNTCIVYKDDLMDFEKFLKENWDILQINKIQPDMIKSYIAEKRIKKYASRSIVRYHSAIRSFIKYLLQKKIIERSPLRSIKSSKKDSDLPQFFDHDTINKFIEFLDAEYKKSNTFISLRDSIFVEFLAVTGIRISELLGLTYKNIDNIKKIIVVKGKGGKQRLVPFTDSLEKKLQIYYTEKNSYINKIGDLQLNTAIDTALFINSRGKALTRRGVLYILTERMKKFGKNCTIYPHKLRHTFATLLMCNGADLRLIQTLMGHSSLISTEVYTHVDLTRKRELYEAFHPHSK